MNDLRIELRARNNVLWHAIFDVAVSVADFCRRYNLAQSIVGGFLNLSRSPYGSRGTLVQAAVQLCDATGLGAGELFPPQLYSGLIPTRMAAEVPSERFVSLAAANRIAIPADLNAPLIQDEIRELVGAAVETLSAREAQVIRARFGFDGDEPQTFRAVGALVGVTQERVRQIEARALRKLRHPQRTRPFLRPALEMLDVAP